MDKVPRQNLPQPPPAEHPMTLAPLTQERVFGGMPVKRGNRPLHSARSARRMAACPGPLNL